MKKITAAILAVSLLLGAVIFATTADAAVRVRGYYRKDGTYVQPHYRSNPDGNPYNNWSFPGNTNPYTGKVAPGNPSTYLENYSNGSSGSSYSQPSYTLPPYSPPPPPSYSAPSYSPLSPVTRSSNYNQNYSSDLDRFIVDYPQYNATNDPEGLLYNKLLREANHIHGYTRYDELKKAHETFVSRGVVKDAPRPVVIPQATTITTQSTASVGSAATNEPISSQELIEQLRAQIAALMQQLVVMLQMQIQEVQQVR